MAPHIWNFPQTSVHGPLHPIYVHKISCTTSVSGNVNVDDKFINGQILKIYYDKGTITTITNVVVSFDEEQIDSYDINTGSAHRYPRVATILEPFVVSGNINVSVTSGQPNKSFDVYIFAR